jgi:hypothetical protein
MDEYVLHKEIVVPEQSGWVWRQEEGYCYVYAHTLEHPDERHA